MCFQVIAAGGLLPLLEIIESNIHVNLRKAACLVIGSLAASAPLQDVLLVSTQAFSTTT